MNDKLKQLKEELKAATQEVYSIEKQMKTESYRRISKYSQGLVQEDRKKAISKQFDVIMKLTELISNKEADEETIMKLVNSATKR